VVLPALPIVQDTERIAGGQQAGRKQAYRGDPGKIEDRSLIMLHIPDWFSIHKWVQDFDDLREAIQMAARKRNEFIERRKSMRSKWRSARRNV